MLRKLAVATLFGITLVSCGGGSDAPPPPPPVVVPPAAPRVEDGFGANFGTAFRADMNTEARDPAVGDLIPLSLTTEPVAI